MTTYRPSSSSTVVRVLNRLSVIIGLVLFILLLVPTFIYSRSIRSGYPYSSDYINSYSLSPPKPPAKWIYSPPNNAPGPIDSASPSTKPKTSGRSYHGPVIGFSGFFLIFLIVSIIPFTTSQHRREALFADTKDTLPTARRSTFLLYSAPSIAVCLFVSIIAAPILAVKLHVPAPLERVWKADVCAQVSGAGGVQHKAVVSWTLGVKIPDASAMDGVSLGGKLWITKARSGGDPREQGLEFVGWLERNGGYVLKYSNAVPGLKAVGNGIGIGEGPEYCAAGNCFVDVELWIPPIDAVNPFPYPFTGKRIGNITYTHFPQTDPSKTITRSMVLVVDESTPGYGQSYERRCIPWTPFALLALDKPPRNTPLTSILFGAAMEMAQGALNRRGGA
ncbi:hypothetical protein EX30DRAFT_362718 [Ascodesmis nigricans]|uniref:Uncharacterized protein n=1 Tax=Ascodesmis nigricans TaxID=341454 RepID=A0A4S2N2A1_9PEZI|nr:hypothetical protein EX30DRAFT_362718 [Ascodesmis nigricans]